MKFPSFRDYDDPSRKLPYGWDYLEAGKRKRPTFANSKDKAKFKKDYLNNFSRNRDAVLSFDPAKWERFLALEKRAGSIDNLERALDAAKESKTALGAPTVSQARTRRLEVLKAKDSPIYSREKKFLDRFLASMGDRPLTYYSVQDVETWLSDMAREHRLSYYGTRNHFLAVRTMFNQIVKDGDLPRNHLAGLTLHKPRGEKERDLLHPDDVTTILRYLEKNDRVQAAVWALLFFTGLRVSLVAVPPYKRNKGEFVTLDMIDVEAKEIYIPAHVTKAQTALIIDEHNAPACLWPWLGEWIYKAELPIAQNTFNKAKRELMETLEIDFPRNSHRRACASYTAALHGKERASSLLGNTVPVLAANYTVASFRGQAVQYFGIRPLDDPETGAGALISDKMARDFNEQRQQRRRARK